MSCKNIYPHSLTFSVYQTRIFQNTDIITDISLNVLIKGGKKNRRIKHFSCPRRNALHNYES